MIDNLRLENQLTELTSLVRQLAIGQHQSNAQETESDNAEIVGAITGYQYGRQSYPSRRYYKTSAESESRAVYYPKIQIHEKHVGSEPKQLSTASSKIPRTTIPTSATIGSTIGQFTFNGRVDEADECK
ncbi:hypothetical protein CR513_23961, partial [Mucuna pruriens]